MYKCDNCSHKFDEPKILETTYEKYCGAPLETRTYLTLELCPMCGSDEFEEIEEDEE